MRVIGLSAISASFPSFSSIVRESVRVSLETKEENASTASLKVSSPHTEREIWSATSKPLSFLSVWTSLTRSLAIPSRRSSLVTSVSKPTVSSPSYRTFTCSFSFHWTIRSPSEMEISPLEYTTLLAFPSRISAISPSVKFWIRAATSFMFLPSFAPRTLKFAFAE